MILLSEEAMQEALEIDGILANENTFLFILAIILIAILIAFSRRVNKLEDSMEKINEKFDKLSSTLIEISKRPCQITDTLGYCVYFSKNKEDMIDNIDEKKENSEIKSDTTKD